MTASSSGPTTCPLGRLEEGALLIEICRASPASATRVTVEIGAGGTVREALERSGVLESLSLEPDPWSFAIFGRRATLETPLHDGDRVEVLRPLIVDPKEARRRRAAKRGTGLG